MAPYAFFWRDSSWKNKLNLLPCIITDKVHLALRLLVMSSLCKGRHPWSLDTGSEGDEWTQLDSTCTARERRTDLKFGSDHMVRLNEIISWIQI